MAQETGTRKQTLRPGRGRKRSFKKLSREAQDAIRMQAVQAIERNGMPINDAALLFQIHRGTLSRWLSAKRSKGTDALRTKTAPGKERKLSIAQEHRIFQVMRKKTPEDFGLDVALWTRECVAKVIKKKFGVGLSLPSITRLLARLEITFKKPTRQASERDPKAVMKWKRVTLPRILKEAKKARASVFFGDEAGIQSDHNSGMTWGPKGERVVVRSSGRREKVNLISAISKAGKISFMLVEGKMSSKTFCTFLSRLMNRRRRPVYLIVDNSSIHKSATVRDHVEQYGGKLRIFFLPAYSPDLNPDELVWADLKSHGVHRKRLNGAGDLRRRTLSHMRSLQKRPAKIAGMFRKAFKPTSRCQ